MPLITVSIDSTCSHRKCYHSMCQVSRKVLLKWNRNKFADADARAFLQSEHPQLKSDIHGCSDLSYWNKYMLRQKSSIRAMENKFVIWVVKSSSIWTLFGLCGNLNNAHQNLLCGHLLPPTITKLPSLLTKWEAEHLAWLTLGQFDWPYRG